MFASNRHVTNETDGSTGEVGPWMSLGSNMIEKCPSKLGNWSVLLNIDYDKENKMDVEQSKVTGNINID